MPEKPRQVGILVLEEDEQNAASVRQILDSEGWRVNVVADQNLLLEELRNGDWALVVANIAVTGFDSPAFSTLRELAAVYEHDALNRAVELDCLLGKVEVVMKTPLFARWPANAP